MVMLKTFLATLLIFSAFVAAAFLAPVLVLAYLKVRFEFRRWQVLYLARRMQRFVDKEWPEDPREGERRSRMLMYDGQQLGRMVAKFAAAGEELKAIRGMFGS